LSNKPELFYIPSDSSFGSVTDGLSDSKNGMFLFVRLFKRKAVYGPLTQVIARHIIAAKTAGNLTTVTRRKLKRRKDRTQVSSPTTCSSHLTI
jgi:hypothetical protein